MDKNNAINLLLENTQYAKEDIIDVQLVSGGLSNVNFKITTKDNKSYHVRFGGHNDIISRTNEKCILDLLKNDQFIYYDLKNGNAIKKWILGDNPTITEIDETFLIALAKEIEKLHSIKIDEVKDVILHDNFGLMPKAKKHLTEKHYQKYLQLSEKYKNLPKVLSHNDTSFRNLLWDKNMQKVYLIDFEWGRINNPYWDYANFVRECDLNLKLAKFLCEQVKNFDWEIFQDHIYMTTNFAVQWTFNMPQIPEIITYQKEVMALMERYYQKFYQ